MKSLLWGLCIAFGVAGCVSQTTISGTDHRVPSHQLDTQSAAKARTTLALQYLQSGDTEQAKYNLDRALQYAPRSPDVHRAFAYYYQQVSEQQLAEQAYRRSLKLAPDDPDTLNNLGVFLCGQGRYDEAEGLFVSAIKQPEYTKVADTYENAGICAKVAGQTDRARQYLQTALSYNPRRPRALLEMAELEMGQGRASEARGYLLRYRQVARPTVQSQALWKSLELVEKQSEAAAASRP